jgi:hypothetical protein
MVSGKKRKAPIPDRRIAHFEHSDNDQDDVPFLECLQQLLGPNYSLYRKSVCFTNRKNKRSWRPYESVSQRTSATIMSFVKLSENVADVAGGIHVAVVEGTIGRVKPKRGPTIVPPWGTFHSCLVMVDKTFKRVYVHNPWREKLLRSRSVKVVGDIRPKLVMKLVKKLSDNYDIYHSSGDQVDTCDCRIRVLHFAQRLGQCGRDHFHTKIPWKKLKKSAKA